MRDSCHQQSSHNYSVDSAFLLQLLVCLAVRVVKRSWLCVCATQHRLRDIHRSLSLYCTRLRGHEECKEENDAAWGITHTHTHSPSYDTTRNSEEKGKRGKREERLDGGHRGKTVHV